MMKELDTGIHSCSYFCERPACIKAQRDKLLEEWCKETGAATKLAVTVLGQEVYDKSPYQEHPLILIECHVAKLKRENERLREAIEAKRLRARLRVGYCGREKVEEADMTDINRAIELLSVITSTRCGNEFSNHYLIDTNDCRAEIAALMRGANRTALPEIDGLVNAEWLDVFLEQKEALATLAAKILEGESKNSINIGRGTLKHLTGNGEYRDEK